MPRTVGGWRHLLENALDAQHPDAPYLADNSLPEFGTLTAADGQSLNYRLFKPRRFDPTRRYPAIVDVYGGPGVQRVLDNWAGSSFTQILTRAGYVVFQLDNRGTSARGTAFQVAIHGKLGDVEVADQVQGARWLGTQGFVDPARIGVWGWSYGGYLTLMLMFKAPDIFRAGVSGAPVTDWRAVRHTLHRTLPRSAAGQRRRLRGQFRAPLRQGSQRQAPDHARHGGRQRALPAQHQAISASCRIWASPSMSWCTPERSTDSRASTTDGMRYAMIKRHFDEHLCRRI